MICNWEKNGLQHRRGSGILFHHPADILIVKENDGSDPGVG